MKTLILAATALALLSAGQAAAAPLLWTLDEVTTVGTSQYHIGVAGTLTGSFEYDPASNVYTNILIRHTPDAVEPTALTFSTFVSGGPTILSLLNGPPNPDGGIGRHSLVLTFAAPLTPAGGEIAVSGSATYFTGIRSEDITGGHVVAEGDPVPEPSTFGISLLGLVGAAVQWRRRCNTKYGTA